MLVDLCFLQAAAEISELQAEATRLLDVHLSKTAEQVRKEQEAALAALTRKLEAAKGARWAGSRADGILVGLVQSF